MSKMTPPRGNIARGFQRFLGISKTRVLEFLITLLSVRSINISISMTIRKLFLSLLAFREEYDVEYLTVASLWPSTGIVDGGQLPS